MKSRVLRTMTTLLVGSGLYLGLIGIPYVDAQTWTPTAGNLTTGRGDHTANLLPSGKVLIAGGSNSTGFLASAELYDPTSGTFAATGSMATARTGGHSGTLLQNGKVLIAGGYQPPSGTGSTNTAELYDPSSGNFTATGSMNGARRAHTATALPNGKVLIAGGVCDNGCAFASAELYDPLTGTFTPTGSMATIRYGATAVLLPNGKVLIAGGNDLNGPLSSAELYDPGAGTFTATGSMGTPRYVLLSALLPTGKVLVAGGQNFSGPIGTAELYDPASGTFSPTGSMTTARTPTSFNLTMPILSTGKALIAGGAGPTFSTILASAELYDPTSGTWSLTGSMGTNRVSYTLTLLSSGQVLAAAGSTGATILNSAELYPLLPPIANAGADQSANTGDSVTLDGSGSSDPNGKPLTYSWSQVGGLPVSLSSSTAVKPTFTAPAVPVGGATLTFQLIVNNGALSSAPATVNVTVKHVNNPPVASAGPNQTVAVGTLVTLDGSASFDPDGDSLTYQWMQIGGPAVVLSSATAVKPTFTASASGTLTFTLTVSDGSLTSSAQVSIVVQPANHPPVANAGANQTVNEGKLVTLDGTASSDPDGDSITYSWSQVSGSPVSISGATSAKPTFTAPLVSAPGATLVFQLTVTDTGGLSSSATVTVTVTHQNPVCSAAEATPASLWPPNHKLVAVKIVGVTDPDNLTVTLTVTTVTQDEPVKGLGSGDTSPDAIVQGQGVLLRAERDGSGNGRVYRVTFQADDGVGGTCTGTVKVVVPHDAQSSAVIDNGQVYNSLQP